MRCDACGRPMKNNELWRLSSDPSAPSSRSMQQLCWECRQTAQDASASGSKHPKPILIEASEVARDYEATLNS